MDAPLYASRKKVYTKDVHGGLRSIKWAVLAICLAIYYTLPWLRWDRGAGVPNQAILLDLWNERFYFFNVVLWPQNIWLLTIALILSAITLFWVSSVFGRLWCGYACPQTVWTDLYMAVERWVQGDRNARMKLDAAPWSLEKLWKKGATHIAWVVIAFWTGGAWVMYYVNAPVVVGEFWTGRATPDVYFMTALFTATTYLLAGWAREQVCTYMCPWPRFQSAMQDEQTLMVTYNAQRGEPRGHGRRDGQTALGDCVDCLACVHVCPTGIDIRNGPQLECINCGLCIDACNHVMERTGFKPWLIGWDTLARQKARTEGVAPKWRPFRPRTYVYAAAFSVIAAVLVAGLATRSAFSFSAIHDRAPMFVRLRDGGVRNAYTLKLANRTMAPASFTLTVEAAEPMLMGLPEQNSVLSTVAHLSVPASEVGTFRLTLQGRPSQAKETVGLRLIKDGTGQQARYSALFFSANPAEDRPQ